MKIEVSLNDYISVKLTKTGLAIMKAHYDEVFTGRLAEYRPRVEIDKNGYTRFQIWEFMSYFGKYSYNGNLNMPYEMNVIIEEAR